MMSETTNNEVSKQAILDSHYILHKYFYVLPVHEANSHWSYL